ncbi:hypothetical protein PSEUBRA_002109 [Kalmanozyma brasiliensis GHG001]|uniref:uncharacterized protein n=1 Tax=Kalmanozyma brasiliensis (strain GHG001) TaxID=1365824 RepID=UPI001CEA13CC|nr:uncharacterized protein PSEUBRA_002109 [Kalmanozyma brasiliensis GHG001]EST08353.2 hypothetical protein PSEUBRA_002109 [Kalmanozyma brasiliensis GHG001]
MTMMDGDDMQRLWSLIEDLTNQLQANRQLCESLQQQADQLRGQAIHSGTGFALRRFNTDLSKEKFESELEALNAHLVKENLSLSQENKQQAVLLREYENTLETVMAKFRSFSHSTQQHTLQLTQHYESLLAQTTHNAAEQTLAAETAFSGTLTHLGGLVRRAMQSLDGEVSDDESDGEDHDGASARKAKRGWVQDPRWYGSGGYTGKTTDPEALRAEEALDRLTEEERLRMENDTLRELLGLKEKSDALISSPDTVQPYVIEAPVASKPLSPAERRASLTVDEATIAAEASGQPPNKALQISSTTRPGDENVEAKPLSPARISPKITPALDRKDQIIEEAILADDEVQNDRGRRASDSSPLIGSDASASSDVTAAPSATESLPAVFAADDAETAPSSIEELRAATQQTAEASQLHATVPAPLQADAATGSDADAITPIDEVEQQTSAGPPTGAEPNMLAEAAPPALVSTGIEEGDGISSNTTVTSASGIDVAEASTSPEATAVAASTEHASLPGSTPSDATASSNDTGLSSVPAADTKSADVPSPAVVTAPPSDSAEGDFEPIPALSTTSPIDDALKAEASETVIPAEPAKQDNQGVTPEVAADAQAPADATPAADQNTVKADAVNTEADASKDAKTLLKPPSGNQGRKDGSPSPGKNRGRGHRGKGNRHNKSNSNAANKTSS